MDKKKYYLSLINLELQIREALLGLEPESRIPLLELQEKIKAELKDCFKDVEKKQWTSTKSR